jgi:predicted exporter
MMLLRQIAYLCIFSLSIAYIHFAFIYPYLGIKYKDNYKKLYIKPIASISHKKLLLLFSILLVVGITNSKYDFDIKNLDYQNHKLKSDESFFRQRLNQNNTVATIISDTSIEALIKKTKKIKDIDSSSLCTLSSLMTNNEYTNRQSLIKSYDFEKIKDELIEYSIQKGFKKEYFNSSYTYELLYPTKIEYTLQILQALNVEVIKKETKYYSYIIVSRDKLPTLIEQNLVEDIRANKFFELSLKKAYNDLVIYGIITIIIILTILYIALKKEIRKALLFLVAPLCMIFLYSLFGKLNIIHLFMIFVILAISIDYGIYINSKNNSKESNVSIFYSLISTFAGFGVLVISSVSSIFSIGIASVLGIFALIVLLSINIL